AREFSAYFPDQRVDAWLNANRDAARDFVSFSPDVFPERLPFKPGFQIPDRRLDGALSHLIAADSREALIHIAGTLHRRGNEQRNEMFGDDNPGCIDRLGVEI